MRISSRVSVGSPTARMAAIAVATLLLAVMATGAVIGGSQLLAGPGIIVVAQDGSGDYTTITEAVEAAEDGHTILVQPGTYTEAITISDDVELTGNRDDPSLVVIQAPQDGPVFFISGPAWLTTELNDGQEQVPYSLLLLDTDAVVSGLTVRSIESSVVVHGGAPELEGLVLDGVGCAGVGDAECSTVAGVVIQAGSRATLDGNTVLDRPIVVVDASEPLFKGNTLSGGSAIKGMVGDETVVRDNTISGASGTAIGVGGSSTAIIEGNTITDSPLGVQLGVGGTAHGNAIVRNNRVSGARIGIDVGADGGTPTIVGNELSGNTTGILIAGTDAIVRANDVRGSASGVSIDRGSPSLEDNTIVDNGVGVAILSPSADPTLSGNTLCGNETNFKLMRNVVMPATDGNDICPDEVAAVSE